MVLVTGPTGSGKSTTLAAMVNHLNENRVRPHPDGGRPDRVRARVQEVPGQPARGGPAHAELCQRAAQAALREDPDAILVGEMRDLETIRLALTAAETGHLVFGTLHTSSAAKTIDRIIDVFPAAEKEMVRAMLSESLQAVISQTLCKLKDGSGRVAAHEIMLGTSAIRNLIRENKVAQMYSAIQTGQNLGMQTLDQNLADLVRRNIDQLLREARVKAKIPRELPREDGRCSHGTRPGIEIHQRPAAADGQPQRVGPVPHGRLPAGHQGGRQGHQGVAPAPDRPAHAGAGAVGHERQAGRRVRAHQGVQLRHLAAGVGRFRVNAFMQQGKVGMVMRVIPQVLPTIDGLGLPQVLKEVAMTKRGLVIMVGATGSGKSPRWPRWSTGATRTPTATSSPSRTRWSSCTRTRTASSPSARSASTPTAGKRR
jgi:Tfp pilus assembly pilus retraction ATPase PilT